MHDEGRHTGASPTLQGNELLRRGLRIVLVSGRPTGKPSESETSMKQFTRPWENKVTDFVVTTIDGRQFRASSENARLSSLVDQCSTKGYCELAVRPRELEHSRRETNTVFFKHGIISISEGSQVQSDLPADQPVSR